MQETGNPTNRSLFSPTTVKSRIQQSRCSLGKSLRVQPHSFHSAILGRDSHLPAYKVAAAPPDVASTSQAGRREEGEQRLYQERINILISSQHFSASCGYNYISRPLWVAKEAGELTVLISRRRKKSRDIGWTA